jgi:hypothetical protein
MIKTIFYIWFLLSLIGAGAMVYHATLNEKNRKYYKTVYGKQAIKKTVTIMEMVFLITSIVSSIAIQ